MEVDQDHSTEVFQIPVQGVLSEVAAINQPYVQKLFDANSDKVMEGVKEIKDLVIGNNKQKSNFIVLGAVQRLVYLIEDTGTTIELKTQAAIVLGSLAKGIETNVKTLLDQRVVEVTCTGLGSPNLRFAEASLRCLRTILTSSEAATNFLYINPAAVIPQLLENINKTTCMQECTCEIISHCCRATEHQNLLLGLNVIGLLGNLLVSCLPKVKVKALNALSVLCYKNFSVCQQCVLLTVGDLQVVDILVKLLAQSQTKAIQLCAAKCLTYMYRTSVLKSDPYDFIITKKVLPCLVRMCDNSCSTEERVSGAETLAYLIELDPPLQRLTYICEQFPCKLEAYFKNPTVGDTKSTPNMKRFKNELRHKHDLRRAGFLAYASLLSNDEDIRKQVTTESLVNHIAEAMTETCAAVRVNALRCFLSLSRSVQLLRTTFQDVGIWKVLLKLLKEYSEQSLEEKQVISSVICNLLLEFCPNKTELQVAGLLQIICTWIKIDALRLNAVWALMNMTFHADFSVKVDVIEALGSEQIFRLFSDDNKEVIVRSLGLFRNILSSKCDVDIMMAQHGVTIKQACKHVLTTFSDAGAGNPSLHTEYELIRAHTVCVLSCIAAGEGNSTIKNFLQDDTKILQQIVSYLSHFDLNVQLASVSFICYFIRMEEPGCIERQTLMKEYGAIACLQQLQSTNDAGLMEKVEEAMHHFQNAKM